MTREALTILEGLHESIMQLRIKNYGIERELYDIDAQVSRAIDHLTALSEPFDPAKHLIGWVKEKKRWALRTPDPNGVRFPDGSTGNQEWFLAHPYLADAETEDATTWHLSHSGMIVYRGHIPTAAFFLALCEALNIEQQ